MQKKTDFQPEGQFTYSLMKTPKTRQNYVCYIEICFGIKKKAYK